MDDETCIAAASLLVDKQYLSIGATEFARRTADTASLIRNRRLPDEGWSDFSIEYLLSQLALMDMNNSSDSVGAGEREGRVYSRLVTKRSFGLAHGIGRSGDITSQQPKAAGSSLMYALTNALALHAIRLCGIRRTEKALVVPVATGMAMVLVLSTLRNCTEDIFSNVPVSRGSRMTARDEDTATASEHEALPPGSISQPSSIITAPGETKVSTVAFLEKSADRRYVIWSRIDQKSCLKAITAAGLTPVVVPLVPQKTDPTITDDAFALTTDVAAILREIDRLGARNVVAVVTTTSCFAPRGADDVVSVARLCAERAIPHVINNAYGLQSSKMCHLVNEAIRVGRVDAFVQSTDKNFMVPVGGAIIASPSPAVIAAVSKLYPGRASSGPILDLFITFLSMGVNGLQALLHQRKEVWTYLKEKLGDLATAYGEQVVVSPQNDISMAMTLKTLLPSASATDTTFFGSMLFTRQISGARVVHPAAEASIEGIRFNSYGASFDDYPSPYMTAAAAIGMSRADVDVFIARMDKAMKGIQRKATKG